MIQTFLKMFTCICVFVHYSHHYILTKLSKYLFYHWFQGLPSIEVAVWALRAFLTWILKTKIYPRDNIAKAREMEPQPVNSFFLSLALTQILFVTCFNLQGHSARLSIKHHLHQRLCNRVVSHTFITTCTTVVELSEGCWVKYTSGWL